MSGRSTISLLLILAGIAFSQITSGQVAVVSSYFNAGDPADEWTEILITADNVSLANFTIRDNGASQGTGAWQIPVTFINTAANGNIWNNLRAGTVILLYHRVNSQPVDNNKSDGYIQLHANDPAYFTGGNFTPTGTLSLGTNGEIVQIRNAANIHVHALAHRSTTGPGWDELPSPKLNHVTATLASNSTISVCPGNNINEYGFNSPQSGTIYTAKSSAFITRGLPNDTASLTGNSNFWRSLRHPAWPSPALNATFTLPSTINLTWNAATDPFPSDNTQGYLILRNPVNSFAAPADGTTYVTGDVIGGATVVAVIPSSQTLAYTDTYPLTCSESVYYRIYTFRYGTDNLNGNNYNVARGRAYNETDFGSASITIPAAPVITEVIATDASCGDNNGSISITATGGTPPVQYSINGGTTWQAGAFFGGLAPGSYTVVIKDSYECEVFYGLNPVSIGMIPAPVAPSSASSDRDNFCADDPGNIVLTANGGSGESLEWFTGSCGGTSVGTGNNLAIPSPETTTTYFVYWTSTVCGNSACASVTVTVIDPPTTSSAGPDQSLCGVLTATLAGNQPSSGSGLWTQVAGPGSSTFTNNTLYNTQVTVTVYGDYTFRWTISTGTACPDSFDDAGVTFSDAITVTAGSNSPVCPGSTIMLTSSISGATYAWTGPNGFTSTEQNPQIPSATPAMEGTYSVTVSDIPGGCPNTTDDTFVDILDLPAAPVAATASPDNVCAGYTGLIQLTAVGGSGTGLNWYENACGGVIIGTGTTLTLTAPAATTTYYAAWTDACGTSDCASVTVTVTEPPTPAAAGPDQSLCGVLTAIMAASDPTVGTGTWSVVSGPGTVTFSDPTAWNAQVTVSAQGVYILRWTTSNGTVCPASEDEVELNFGDAIQVMAGSNSPLCTGQDIYLTSSIAGATYQWTGPGGFTSSQQNPVIPNATLSAAGVYTVLVTNIPGGCPDTQDDTEVVMNLSPEPPVSVTASLTEICEDYSGTITLSANGGAGMTLQWYSGGCGNDPIGTGPVLVISPPASTSAYFARWETIDCGNSDCQSVTITVEPAPTTANAGPDQSICNNLYTTMSANMPLVGNGQWSVVSGPGTLLITDPASPTTLVNASIMGVYVLRWTITGGTLCTPSSDEVSVEFGNQIVVSVSSNSPVCEGEDLTLFSSINGATYSWTGPGGFTSTVQNPVIPNAGAADAGDYTITVTDIPGGCPSTSATLTAVVGTIPAAPSISSQNIMGSQQDVCAGSTVNYAITAPVSGSAYNWSLSGGGVITPGASSDLIEIEWLAASGTFAVTVTETSPEGCTGEAYQLTVNILPATVTEISISTDQNPVCQGDPVTFTATVAGGGATPAFQWMINGVSAGGNTAVFTLASPGNNDVISCQVVSSLPCADPPLAYSNAIALAVIAPLQVNIIAQGDICAGASAVLSAASAYASYLWSDGSTGPSITITEAGTYSLYVTDENGCSGADTLIVVPCETGPVFFVPNAFSPNGDGNNDHFLPACSNHSLVSDFELIIYNRWGQLIFRSLDIGGGWDGTINGKPCPSGMYSYLLNYRIAGAVAETVQLAGSVMIVR